MKRAVCILSLAIVTFLSGVACDPAAPSPGAEDPEDTLLSERLSRYTTVRLTTDLSALTDSEREMIPHLLRAAEAMDRSYWRQAYGDEQKLMASLESDDARRYAEINYGPWDRLDGNEPFVEGFEEKPEGANFYPEDMTREEFEGAASESEERAKALESLYTMVRRNAEGKLETIPYSVFFEESYGAAAEELKQAAALAEDEALERYLQLRAQALLSDDYRESDMAWMDMKNNTLEVVIGPIETYEDQLFGYKAASEAFVLVKDREWSERLSRYVAFLAELQKVLPVPDEYKQETPGLDSDLNAYDVIYYSGDGNAGAKAIAVNLPNDEEVQLRKGTRRLQLKNAMRAKFDEILTPIAGMLIAEDQREGVQFDPFFENVMFHEVAHGLGIKNTITGEGTVRAALKEQASALEEAKADVLGLFMVLELSKRGEIEGADMTDNYVTFLASIFRSVRFGSADAHGRANLMQLSYLEEKGAFAYDPSTKTYRVVVETMEPALSDLASTILKLQGDGDYEGLVRFNQKYQVVSPRLQESLDRVSERGVPVDVVFEQGAEVLGLSANESS
ncbi:MAG: dipeptidyl-peptidase 3 family protein [Vicinamibacteria bacterium]